MRWPSVQRLVLLFFLSVSMFAESPRYQKGSVVAEVGGLAQFEIHAGDFRLGIARCGKLQSGQELEFRIDGDKVYIRRDSGKEFKCDIVTRTGNSAAFEPPPPSYLKGIILGYGVRRDTHYSSGANGSVSSWNRKAKVYELKGPELVYRVDYCGAFQAGQFSPGQVVDFRVAEKEGRLYIRHDMTKEYSCQLEGTRLPDNAVVAPPLNPSPSTAAAESKPSSSDGQK